MEDRNLASEKMEEDGGSGGLLNVVQGVSVDQVLCLWEYWTHWYCVV